eukprot:snap_masked-scaffold_1-processed-gene-0.36-mRNA-1 protein AED:1.00 eAED:1.00 QI:0/-1/0/0/-1/1/1/0/179
MKQEKEISQEEITNVIFNLESILSDIESSEPEIEDRDIKYTGVKRKNENLEETPSDNLEELDLVAEVGFSPKKKFHHSSWTEEENSWLIGIVFDQIFENGCLPPQKDGICIWEKINEKFEKQREKHERVYVQVHGVFPVKSSPSILKRRFKTLRSMVSKKNKTEYFKNVYNSWKLTQIT